MEISAIPEVGETPKKVCAVCQAPADKSCSACHKVAYCSADHQKSDWKVHKKDCPPIRITTSPELGRHFVATRDLPPWTLLLTELPVLVSPNLGYKGDPISCISCRTVIRPTDACAETCLKCSVPCFCNQYCSMNKVHSEFECGILSKLSKRKEDYEDKVKLCIMPNLGYLRAIHLKNKDPETFAKLLEARGVDQYKPNDADENDKWFVRKILPHLGEKGVGFEADMAKLKGIYQQRGILLHRHPLGGHGETQLLYLKANNLVHDCFPNCTKIISKGPQLQLQVRTSVGIKKGQIPTIDFGGMLMGAVDRQHKLHDIGGALCICPRCKDPTELGTMSAAIKCTQPNCEEGYLLPVDPMDMADDALWSCNRAGCKGNGSTWADIKKLLSAINLDVVTFRESVPLADFERTSEFFESLKKKLHPNHGIIITLERGLADALNLQIVKNKDVRFSLPRMDLHIAMCEHLVEMILPIGISISRANLLTMLYNGYNIRLEWTDIHQGCSTQRKLFERTIEIIDTLVSLIKFFPDNWGPHNIQNLMESRRLFQIDIDLNFNNLIYVHKLIC